MRSLWVIAMLDRRLLYFLEIVDRGGFRRASETLRITQPALTKAIRNLELELGTTLLERHASGVSPTKAGQLFARRVRGMVIESRAARAELEAAAGGGTHLLRIGAGAGWASQILPTAVVRLRQRQPGVRIALQVGTTHDVHSALLADDLDIGFGALAPLNDEPGIDLHPLRSVSNVLFVRPSHPLALRGGSISIADALTYSWIMLQHEKMVREEIAARLTELGLPPLQPAIECSSVIACMNLAIQDDSVLCISELLAVEASRHGLTVLPIKLALFVVGAWHLSHLAKTKMRFVKALVDLARQESLLRS